jgi:hypothetical protein
MHVIRADQALAASQRPLDARRREGQRDGGLPSDHLQPTPLDEVTPGANGST